MWKSGNISFVFPFRIMITLKYCCLSFFILTITAVNGVIEESWMTMLGLLSCFCALSMRLAWLPVLTLNKDIFQASYSFRIWPLTGWWKVWLSAAELGHFFQSIIHNALWCSFCLKNFQWIWVQSKRKHLGQLKRRKKISGTQFSIVCNWQNWCHIFTIDKSLELTRTRVPTSLSNINCTWFDIGSLCSRNVCSTVHCLYMFMFVYI